VRYTRPRQLPGQRVPRLLTLCRLTPRLPTAGQLTDGRLTGGSLTLRQPT
jgi:hypothetical protein